MFPRSRRGGEHKHNLFPWDEVGHSAWHTLFRHMTIAEVWEVFDDVYSAVIESKSVMVIPKWWKVCPFIPSEAHIPKKPVERSYLHNAWRNCFKTDDLEKSRLLLKMMLLFFIFDGALYDRKGLVSMGRLNSIVRRLKKGSQRHWAFRACFDEEPAGNDEQIGRVAHAVQYIFSHSPYIPSR